LRAGNVATQSQSISELVPKIKIIGFKLKGFAVIHGRIFNIAKIFLGIAQQPKGGCKFRLGLQRAR